VYKIVYSVALTVRAIYFVMIIRDIATYIKQEDA